MSTRIPFLLVRWNRWIALLSAVPHGSEVIPSVHEEQEEVAVVPAAEDEDAMELEDGSVAENDRPILYRESEIRWERSRQQQAAKNKESERRKRAVCLREC